MGIETTTWWRIQSHIYEHYIPYLTGLNTVIFAIIGILFELNTQIPVINTDTKTVGWILFLIVIFSTIFQIMKQVEESQTIEKLEIERGGEIESLKEEKLTLDIKIQKLENQLAKINNTSIEIVEVNLAYLFEKMNLGNSERISLYKFIDDKFYVLGRFSSNPELKKRGRSSYKKEGLIFKAWQLGKFTKLLGIPPPNISTRTKFRKGYYKILNEIAPINEETLWNMKMKSRSLYLKALKDSSNVENTSIIVIESLNESGFLENKIDEVLNSDEERKLVTFVEKIDWVFPNINNATEIGF